jgi:hypothetical protein
VVISPRGLIMASGRRTAQMAEETVDRAVELFERVGPRRCSWEVRLVGSKGWAKNMFIGLIQRVRLVVPKETVVDTFNSTASKRKSCGTSPTTTGIVRGPSASNWSRQANDGYCMASS